ncbi:MAG: alternative ribosome rescue aminoacyl-tRNA hydrolase ArfB [Gemmatimonadaceae bacterium]
MESDDIVIDASHVIPAGELVVRASRAGGAGGQHVNTSSTRIELLWNPGLSAALSPGERRVVVERLAKRLDSAGFIRFVSSETRSQLQNRERAKERLADLVRAALVPQKVRRATKPSRAEREKRITEKKQQSQKKSERRRPDFD